jgi:hypothetical protein
VNRIAANPNCKKNALEVTMQETAQESTGIVKHDFADVLIALISGVPLALVAITICTIPFANIMGGRDFTVYWATGQQLVRHANPYDKSDMIRIEHEGGVRPDAVGFMRNPPWALPLTWPLGLIRQQFAAFLWSLILLASLLVSVHWLHEIYGRPPTLRHWIGASFAPAVICLLVGQTSILVLLGYVLFLKLHCTRPFWAGTSLWLCGLKPHLFLVAGVVLLAWILTGKRYRVLAGAAAALAVSLTATLAIDPAAITQYGAMMRESGIQKEAIPCVSIVLRKLIDQRANWLQYLPAGLGCAWAIAYWWRRRKLWDWLRDGNLVLLVSLVLAPYSWITDQVTAIPALLEGSYRTRSQLLPVLLAGASVVAEAQLLSGTKLASNWFLWTAPAWLVWYLVACRTEIQVVHAAA